MGMGSVKCLGCEGDSEKERLSCTFGKECSPLWSRELYRPLPLGFSLASCQSSHLSEGAMLRLQRWWPQSLSFQKCSSGKRLEMLVENQMVSQLRSRHKPTKRDTMSGKVLLQKTENPKPFEQTKHDCEELDTPQIIRGLAECTGSDWEQNHWAGCDRDGGSGGAAWELPGGRKVGPASFPLSGLYTRAFCDRSPASVKHSPRLREGHEGGLAGQPPHCRNARCKKVAKGQPPSPVTGTGEMGRELAGRAVFGKQWGEPEEARRPTGKMKASLGARSPATGWRPARPSGVW